jgi:iron complex transport system ATP-binding protein
MYMRGSTRHTAGVLVAEGITVAYADRAVLRGIDISLAAGEVVALIGPNGSGKTSLIRGLLGAVRSTGSIRWFERPLHEWPRRELARRIAYLPQSPTWDPGQRVIDVLRLGRTPYGGAFGIESRRDAEVVSEVASGLELGDLLDRPIDELSGGQRQRVFLGRCLAQEPSALLLDEPNTYLDLRHQVELCQRLRRLAAERGIGVLMAVHDLTLASLFADRVVLLDGGVVTAAGPPGEVLAADVISAAYGVPLVRLPGPGGRPVLVPAASG